MPVAVKRVYEAPAASDGVRVLVDRLWPRGLTKEKAAIKHWMRDLAPSDALRKWYHANPSAWAMFRKRYFKELRSEEAATSIQKLHQFAAGKRRLTLLFASRNLDRNNATALKELLDGAPKPPSSVGRIGAARMPVAQAKRR